MEGNNNKFNLRDFMTAAQAQRIIDLLEDLEKRVSNLEAEQNLTVSAFKDIELQRDLWNYGGLN